MDRTIFYYAMMIFYLLLLCVARLLFCLAKLLVKRFVLSYFLPYSKRLSSVFTWIISITRILWVRGTKLYTQIISVTKIFVNFYSYITSIIRIHIFSVKPETREPATTSYKPARKSGPRSGAEIWDPFLLSLPDSLRDEVEQFAENVQAEIRNKKYNSSVHLGESYQRLREAEKAVSDVFQHQIDDPGFKRENIEIELCRY